MDHASIAVSIVNYNTREYLRACLATVVAQRPAEVVVVDNASSDGSIKMLEVEFPHCKIIANSTNPGYGAASNQAINACVSQYILLLNSDTLLQPGALQALSEYMLQHPKAGIVGPRLADPDGSLQASCFSFPSPFHVFFRENILSRAVGSIPLLGELYLPTWSHAFSRVVPWVLGAALVIRRMAFDAVGGFDESFFMYYEEVDLCYRLHICDWEVHFAPVTTVTHVREASSAQNRANMAIMLYRSLARFYRLHYSKRRMCQLHAIISAIMLRNIVFDAVRLRCADRAGTRALLAENLAAWASVLSEQWHSKVAHGRRSNVESF